MKWFRALIAVVASAPSLTVNKRPFGAEGETCSSAVASGTLFLGCDSTNNFK
jgi:hypothetical protein